MPITSQQVGGMIGGQQAMFGNFASYAQQISPGFQGSPPSYANPMSGSETPFAAPPTSYGGFDPSTNQIGAQAISAAGNIGLPALGTAAMLGGSMLPGAAGRAFGGMDPLTAGWRGMKRGAGFAKGVGTMANLGRIASGGIGSIARAGIGGVAGGMMAAAPIMALGQAAQYSVGQMVEGAQFQGQVQNTLQNQFRHTNAQSRTGFGFSRQEGGQITDMLRTMGHQDMMSGPSEMLKIMKQGTQMGLFRAVQDVKEFKKRFTDMVGSLKEVAKTMNTTLEGAMPFFQQSRQQGFWTPQDISRNAQTARTTAQAAGTSVAQAQAMMGQGAQMARSVGAQGWQGAQGMAQSLQLVGGGMRSGMVGEREMSEATGGLQGAEAVQSMAGTLQAATTRFASSRRGRWVLAALGRNKFGNLSAGGMQDLMSGMTSISEIGKQARRNIGKQGAYNFVLNEQKMRGDLIKQGPEAQLGFVRTLIGGRMYGEGAKNKLITRRLMKRYFGVSSKQSDVLVKLARQAPQIMRENRARSASVMDQEERNRSEMMDRGWEGIKRKAATWWDKAVKDPLQKLGADMSREVGDYWEKMGDKMWGSTPTRHRFRGISKTGMQALQRGAMGDTRAMETAYGKAGDFAQMFGGGGAGVGGEGLAEGGIARSFKGQEGLFGAGHNVLKNLFGAGEFTNARIQTLRKMGVAEYGFGSEEKLQAGMKEQGLVRGRQVGGTISNLGYRAFAREDVESAQQGLYAATTGTITARTAKALGFQSEKVAKSAIEAAQTEMSTSSYKVAAARIADLTSKSGRELATAQVRAIEAGRMGGESTKALLKGAKTMAEKVHRLAAAQTPGMRRLVGGIDLTGEAKDLGLAVFTGAGDMERQIGKAVEAAEGGLAKALTPEGSVGAMAAGMRSSVFAPGVQVGKDALSSIGAVASPDTIAKLSEKGGDKFKRAMMLMNSGSGKEDRAKNRAEARKLLGELTTDKTMSKQERGALRAMMDGGPEVQAAMADLGKTFQFKERAEFNTTVLQRSQRMMGAMGEQGKRMLDALDKVKGASGKSIGALVRELTEEKDPKAYAAKMAQLVQTASTADADESGQAVAMLTGVAGAEHLVDAIKGGRQTGQMVTALKGAGKGGQAGRRATLAANMLMGGLVGKKGMAPAELKTLMGTGKAAEDMMETLVKRAPDELKDRTRNMLQAMRDGSTSKLTKFTRDKHTAEALSLLADPKKSILHEQIRQMKPGEVQGQLGSPSGMHTEMIKQTLLLAKIAEKEEGEAVGNPKEKPEGT
jgi:hypothetical protein